MKKLSPAELDKTLRAIVEYHAAKGYYPSLRDLARQLGLRSVSSCAARVGKLVDDGLVRRHPTNGMIVSAGAGVCGDVATSV
jgi:DNA-binding Lrp family transcriptional regulator